MNDACPGLEAAALNSIAAWFARHSAGFRAADPVVDENIRLKIEHTRRVRDEAPANRADPLSFATLPRGAHAANTSILCR